MADNKGPVQVPASDLIQVGGTNFLNTSIDSMKASAPAFHHNIDRALQVSGKVQVQDPVVSRAMQYAQSKQVLGFTRGAPVRNKEGRKLTIFAAAVGHTKKTKTLLHKVIDKDGNTWLEKESNLVLRLKT